MLLEKRRVRGDLIETFKIMKGFEKVNAVSFFALNNSSRTREHSLKMEKLRSNIELSRKFLVGEWLMNGIVCPRR